MRSNTIIINEILVQIELIEKSFKKGTYDTDRDVQDAILRRLEIIGEAVKSVSPSLKKKYSSIEWKKIAGLRDILIHNYFGVDLLLVKNVVKKDIPLLKKELLQIRKNGDI